MKSKTATVLLAFFLGGLGAHKFYLGQTGQGILYLLFCWTLIPSIIAFIEFIMLIVMYDHTFNMKYNSVPLMASHLQGTQISPNIVVNVPGSASKEESKASEEDIVTLLEKLHQLRVSGAISEEEFEAQKARLLESS